MLLLYFIKYYLGYYTVGTVDENILMPSQLPPSPSLLILINFPPPSASDYCENIRDLIFSPLDKHLY